MPTPSQQRPTVGPVVAPRIGRQRLPWQADDAIGAGSGAAVLTAEQPPVESPVQPSVPPPGDAGPEPSTGNRGGGGIIGLLVVVVVLLVALPTAFWFLDYGGLNPLASTSSATRPPSALPATGSYVDARVQPGGTVRVTQWVRPPSPLQQVSLKVQPRSGPDAVASAVQVSADGRRVAGPVGVTHDVATYQWQRPARLLRLTYTLSNVVDESRTTARHTVLASTFLAVRYPRRGPTVARVSGAGVRSLSCAPVLGAAGPRPCGRQVTGSDWQVELRGPHLLNRVLAKLGAF